MARAKRRALPPISFARFAETTSLVERLVGENTDLFIAAGQDFLARYRRGASRPLNHLEIAQLAGGLGVTLTDAVGQAADAGLTGYDEPSRSEVLVAAGIGTAPQYLAVAAQLVALLELPEEEFWAAREAGGLPAACAKGVVELEKLPLVEVRARADAALRHLATEAGSDPGKAWGFISQAVLQGLRQAMSHLLDGIGSSGSSTFSPPSTDGPGETSSTAPPGATSGT